MVIYYIVWYIFRFPWPNCLSGNMLLVWRPNLNSIHSDHMRVILIIIIHPFVYRLKRLRLFSLEMFSFFRCTWNIIRKYFTHSPDLMRKHQQQHQPTSSMTPTPMPMRREQCTNAALTLFASEMSTQTIENMPNSRVKQTCVKSSKCARCVNANPFVFCTHNRINVKLV